MPSNDKVLLEGILSRTDVAYLKGNKQLIEDSFISIAKSVRFLGFYDEKNIIKTKDDKGQQRSCLEAFSDVMAKRMEHTRNDRDLIVMRHNFIIENEKKERWGHSSTWIESG